MMDELDELRGFRSDAHGPSDASRAQARAALDEAIFKAQSKARTGRRWERRGRLFSRLAIVSSAAAICAVMLALVIPGTGGRTAAALAAPTLNRLAQIAASGPSLVPGPGQYLYVDSESSYSATANNTCITYAPDHRQVWIAPDGSGLLQEADGRTSFTSAADHAACAQMHMSSRTGGVSRVWFAADCFELGPAPNMQDLSTNPQTLLRQMRRLDGGPRTPAEDFVHVGDFLRETDASPALRAALYRAAALIPGVRLLGTVRDHLGRAGLGVALNSRGVHHELIFNPRTSALMGETDHGSAPGTDDWAVYLDSRVVDALPKASPRPLTPACVAGAGRVHQVPGGSVIAGIRPQTERPSAHAGPVHAVGR